MAWFNWFSRSKAPLSRGVAASAPLPRAPAPPPPAAESAKNLPGFHGSASDILHNSRYQGSARVRVRDAFTPSQPVIDPRLFAGRTEVLRTLIRSVEDLRLHVVLYGERGVGKTSMLHVLTHLARSAQYHTVYYSCGERSTFTDTFRTIAADIPLLYHGGFDPGGDAVRGSGTLADVLPAGDFSANQLSEVFAQLSNTRVLIVLDEFDRSPSGAFRRGIAELIKNLSDRSVRVQLVIAGVAANLAELVEHIPSIRRNVFGLRIPSMDGAEITELVRIGEEISGLPYAPEAIERIIAVANGSPYLASLLGQYAGFAALERSGEGVSADDVAVATRLATVEFGQRISERGRDAVERALADGHGQALHRLADIAMATMGRLDESRLDGVIADRSCGDVATLFRDRYSLIAALPGEMAGRHGFVEEAVPTWVWLMFSGRADGAQSAGGAATSP